AGRDIEIRSVEHVGSAGQIELVRGGLDQLVAASAKNVSARVAGGNNILSRFVGQPQVAVRRALLRFLALADDRALASGRYAELLLADEHRARSRFFLGLVGQDLRRQTADEVFELVVIGIENARVAVTGFDAPLANDALHFIDL